MSGSMASEGLTESSSRSLNSSVLPSEAPDALTRPSKMSPVTSNTQKSNLLSLR